MYIQSLGWLNFFFGYDNKNSYIHYTIGSVFFYQFVFLHTECLNVNIVFVS